MQQLSRAGQTILPTHSSHVGLWPSFVFTPMAKWYFLWDIHNYPPRKVFGFPTRDDLEDSNTFKSLGGLSLMSWSIHALLAVIINCQAIRSVLEGLEKKRRKFLLIMATGTGKTRTCIALIDAIMKGAQNEFYFLLTESLWGIRLLTNSKVTYLMNHVGQREGRVWNIEGQEDHVSTYPTMLNIIRDEQNSLSPHFFDLIVVDESHRSIYNTYQRNSGLLQYDNS